MLKNIESKNIRRKFDSLQKKRLGTYVYGLRDPRDGKIFYVGQGSGDRVFQHFSEAEGLINGTQKFTSKRIRIIDIWNDGEDVDWIILAHNLPQEAVNYVESAAIDSLSASQNGQVLNDVSGPWSSMLNHGEIDVLGAKPVNPAVSYSKVFIFPIHNGLKESSKSVYESTRAAWSISQKFQSKDSIAVGLQHGILYVS